MPTPLRPGLNRTATPNDTEHRTASRSGDCGAPRPQWTGRGATFRQRCRHQARWGVPPSTGGGFGPRRFWDLNAPGHNQGEFVTRFPDLYALLTGATIPAAIPQSGQPDAASKPEQIVSTSGRITGCSTDDDQEVRRLQQERLALLPRQIGRPDNRRRMRDLTTAQLRAEAGA